MPKIPKYSVIKKEGDKWLMGYNHKETYQYKDYEAVIRVKHVSSSVTETKMILKSLKEEWENSIDQWEEEKENPSPAPASNSSNNQNQQNQASNTDTSTPDKPAPFTVPKGDFEKLVDKVKEIQDDVKKTIPEKAKDMKKVMEEIEKNNLERTKDLRAAEDKLNEERVEAAARIKEAEEAGNENAKKIFAAKMKELDIKIAENLAKQGEVPTKDDYLKMLEELEKDKQKSFLEKINWKNPWTYGVIGLFFIVLFTVVFLCLWIWGRIKSNFSK